jgi:hypothetical protein
MRTFHIGGTASSAYKEPVIAARNAGTLHLVNVRTVKNQKGETVVVSKNGYVIVYDAAVAKAAEEQARARAKAEAEAIGTFYNKELYETYFSGQKTPMDMVDSNDWTFEKLFSLTRDVYIPASDGSAENAYYGISVYETDIDAFQTAAGITSLEKTEDGGLRISEKWDSQRCADACEMVGLFLQSEGVYHGTEKATRSIFFNEQSIFHVDRVLIMAGQDNTDTGKVEFSCGIVPVPKFEVSQENYQTNLGNSFSIYAVNNNSKIAEIAVTTLEAMGSENYRSVTPAVFEITMKQRYADDAQSSRMYDILRSTVSFDMGRLFSAYFSNYTSKSFRVTALSTAPSGFLTLVEARSKGIKKNLQSLMKAFED